MNLSLPDSEDRAAAAELLGRIGSPAAKAIPELQFSSESAVGAELEAIKSALLKIQSS
jgi:hypothetical protein